MFIGLLSLAVEKHAWNVMECSCYSVSTVTCKHGGSAVDTIKLFK